MRQQTKQIQHFTQALWKYCFDNSLLDAKELEQPQGGCKGGDLKPARPELVVGYTFHRLLVAQLGTMVTPSPKPTATHRMNRLRLVSGSIEMTYAKHCNVSGMQIAPRV